AVGGLLAAAPSALSAPSGKLPGHNSKHIANAHQQKTTVTTAKAVDSCTVSGWWIPSRFTIAQR
ncbi:MAG: hypothetical protein KC978_21740, partial [Candidatus Omnitrophica bacterium]|nr:hypothetical protein [Candidatus Omnitrophota bacterium]